MFSLIFIKIIILLVTTGVMNKWLDSVITPDRRKGCHNTCLIRVNILIIRSLDSTMVKVSGSSREVRRSIHTSYYAVIFHVQCSVDLGTRMRLTSS